MRIARSDTPHVTSISTSDVRGELGDEKATQRAVERVGATRISAAMLRVRQEDGTHSAEMFGGALESHDG